MSATPGCRRGLPARCLASPRPSHRTYPLLPNSRGHPRRPPHWTTAPVATVRPIATAPVATGGPPRRGPRSGYREVPKRPYPPAARPQSRERTALRHRTYRPLPNSREHQRWREPPCRSPPHLFQLRPRPSRPRPRRPSRRTTTRRSARQPLRRSVRRSKGCRQMPPSRQLQRPRPPRHQRPSRQAR